MAPPSRIFTFPSSAPPNLRIECRRRTIWCHRGILRQHSGYFYDHFRGGRFYWQPIHTMRFRANVDVDALIAAISACYDSSGRYEYAVPEHRDERVFHSKVRVRL
jgi:hypothetical protein